jgi:hypothetical protein
MYENFKEYAARTFNTWWAQLFRFFPREGVNARLAPSGDGLGIFAEDSAEFRHPWWTTTSWSEEEQQWRSTTRPGFINGYDVTVETVVEGKTKQVPLTAQERPSLPLSWRNVLAPRGVTASIAGEFSFTAGEGYPKFFESVGVKPAHPGGSSETGEEEEGRTRELRACDIFVKVPRIATKQQVTEEGLESSRAFVITSVFVNDFVRASESRYQLHATPKWTAPVEPTALDRLLGTAVEPQTDEILIATMWAVSPEDTEAEAEVTSEWTIYKQYHVWWNLMHASRNVVPKEPNPPIRIVTGLVAGIADSIFASLLTPVNQANAQIDAFLGAGDFSGRFWTT